MNKENFTELLELAIEENNLEVVKFAIDKGADIHVREEYNLRRASANGYIEIVELLLDTGADIHADEEDSLLWASKNGHTETVKLLLDRGAIIHPIKNHVFSAFMNGHTETVKVLKEYLAKEKKVETIKIGDMTYNKDEIEEKLKDLKPLDS